MKLCPEPPFMFCAFDSADEMNRFVSVCADDGREVLLTPRLPLTMTVSGVSSPTPSD
ncbi:hypothetical protein [Mycolicibacterium sp. 624]|uniref:hypothetical protein n=1 Tax=Mycolicibacterium sp. 624 TaxID=3156314 RepID=UPI0033912964